MKKCNPDQDAFASESNPGLTKREYIAALALQGILSHADNTVWGKTAAEIAVKSADALIEELNKE